MSVVWWVIGSVAFVCLWVNSLRMASRRLDAESRIFWRVNYGWDVEAQQPLPGFNDGEPTAHVPHTVIRRLAKFEVSR